MRKYKANIDDASLLVLFVLLVAVLITTTGAVSLKLANDIECDRYSLDAVYHEKYQRITEDILADSSEFVSRVTDLMSDSMMSVMADLPDSDSSDVKEKGIFMAFNELKKKFIRSADKIKNNITVTWQSLLLVNHDLMVGHKNFSLEDLRNKTLDVTEMYMSSRRSLDAAMEAVISPLKAIVSSGMKGINVAAAAEVRKEMKKKEKEGKEGDEEEKEKEGKEGDEEEKEKEGKEGDEEEKEKEGKEGDEEENEKEGKEGDEKEKEKEGKEGDEEEKEKEGKEGDEEEKEKEGKEGDEEEKEKEGKEGDEEEKEKEGKEGDEEEKEKEGKEGDEEEKEKEEKQEEEKKEDELDKKEVYEKMKETVKTLVPGFLGKVSSIVLERKISLQKKIEKKSEDRDSVFDDLCFSLIMVRNRVMSIIHGDLPRNREGIDLGRRNIYMYWAQLATNMYKERIEDRRAAPSRGIKESYRRQWEAEGKLGK